MPELISDWRGRLAREMRRKAIHLTGLSVPAGIILFGRTITAAAIAVVLAASLVLEALRLKGKVRLPETREQEETAWPVTYITWQAASLLCYSSLPR